MTWGRPLSHADHDRLLLQPLGGVVQGMERAGLTLDRSLARDICARAAADAAATTAELDDWAARVTGRTETNWGYWAWLLDLFHSPRPGGLALPPSPYWKKGRLDTEAGERSTDDRALEYLAAHAEDPETRNGLHALRRLRRQLRVATFADTLVALAIPHPNGTWTVHPQFGLSHDGDTRPGARTGRFGVKNPPMQQVRRPGRGEDPYPLRRCVIAPPGRRLVVADYAQLELVVLAHICAGLWGRTPGCLADKLRRGADDLHSVTAIEVWGRLGETGIRDVAPADLKKHPVYGWHREVTKAIRYGLNYGKGDYGFGWTLFNTDGSPLGEDRAGELRRALFDADPEIELYQGFVRDNLVRWGGISSLLGRFQPLPGAASHRSWERNRALRQAWNFPMQAGAQEITAAAMIAAAADDFLTALGFVTILQVHDELIGHVPEDRADDACARLREIMETTFPLRCDLVTEPGHGENWERAKPK